MSIKQLEKNKPCKHWRNTPFKGTHHIFFPAFTCQSPIRDAFVHISLKTERIACPNYIFFSDPFLATFFCWKFPTNFFSIFAANLSSIFLGLSIYFNFLSNFLKCRAFYFLNFWSTFLEISNYIFFFLILPPLFHQSFGDFHLF